MGDETDFALDAFREMNETLAPPVLRDDTVGPTSPPESAQARLGSRRLPDPSRRQAMTGSWLYRPAASADARSFIVEHNDSQWSIGEAKR